MLNKEQRVILRKRVKIFFVKNYFTITFKRIFSTNFTLNFRPSKFYLKFVPYQKVTYFTKVIDMHIIL